MRLSTSDMAAAATGAIAAKATNVWLQRKASRTPLAAVILVGAAVAYPIAGGAPSERAVARREAASLGATLAVAVAAAALPDRPARSVVVVGWLLHAIFDQLHTVSARSRLPQWYPALCAGYDLAMAAALSQRPAPAARQTAVQVRR